MICHAVARLDKIPEDLVADRDLDLSALKTHAEQHLLAEAEHHDANELRILGRHLLDVVAPEVAEEHERRLLEQEEERARAKTRLTMTEDGQGCVHGRFTLPALQASMLKKALLALAAPKHQAAVDGAAPVPGRPSAERMGQAFCEYVERYPADRIPDAGGVPASVVITMDLEKLLQGLGAGVLDDGGRISATEARRLACEAGIIPAVLGGKGQPLDVGRKKRFHTIAQRIATGDPRRRLHRRGMRLPARALSRPPRHLLGTQRRHQRQGRTTALSPTSRPGAQPALQHHPTRDRQAQVHQAHVSGDLPDLGSSGGRDPTRPGRP